MNYSPRNNERELEKVKATGKKVRNKALIVTLRVVLFVFLISCFALVGVVFGAYIGIIQNSPTITTAIQPENYTSIVYLADTGEEYDRFEAKENREYVEIENISKYLQDAVVAIEDERFYTHNGVDPKGMVRALYVNLTANRTEGASTITQQLIKNNVANKQSNTLDSKLREQYLAVKYEAALEKELGSREAAKKRVLEVYLNTIALHFGLNGVQTGANYYFGKDAKDLTLSESAVIASITNSPTRYNPVDHPDNNKTRMEHVLDKMLELGFITEAQHKEAMADDVYSRISGYREVKQTEEKIRSYYLDTLVTVVIEDLVKAHNISDVEAKNWLFNKGLKIHIPYDPSLQAIVDDVVDDSSMYPSHLLNYEASYELYLRNLLTDKVEDPIRRTKTVYSEEEANEFAASVDEEYATRPNYVKENGYLTKVLEPQAAFVLMEQDTGYVRAISGGRGEKKINMGFNRATQAKRSPGSVYKVLASYAPALELGAITPATVIIDEPFTVNNYTPSNWWGKNTYKGAMTVRQGIVTSANVVTVKNMYETGFDRCLDFLQNKFHFTTLVDEFNDGRNDMGLSVALGGLTYGVYQTEVAAAYAAIANGGLYQKPKFYTQVYSHDGTLLLDNDAIEPERILSEGNAYILTDMMKDVISSPSGTGNRAAFQYITMPEAGKTGTTTDTEDLTFVGYTPYYVGSIWTGYDNSKSMGDGSNNFHLNIWRVIMERVHENLEYKEFPRPENIIEVSICKDSGKLAGSSCYSYTGGRAFKELFISGTEPESYCDIHGGGGGVRVCTVSGKMAGNHCPSDVVEIRRWSPSDEYCDVHYAVEEEEEYYEPEPTDAPVEEEAPPTVIDETVTVTTPNEDTEPVPTDPPTEEAVPTEPIIEPEPTYIPTFIPETVDSGGGDVASEVLE